MIKHWKHYGMMNNNVDRPIIILGAPRSGTSVLARILCQHRDFAYVNEPRLIWRYGNDRCSDMLNTDHARPKVVKYIRSKFHQIVDSQGRLRLLEKTPSNSLRVDFINEVFPDCKFIHIIRNGYDSALSIRGYWDSHVKGIAQNKIDQKDNILIQRLREMHPRQIPFYMAEFLSRMMPQSLSKRRVAWGPRLPGMPQMIDDLDLLALCALQWKMCVEHASLKGRAYGQNRYFECRLEELDIKTIREITEFCELPFDNNVDRYINNEFDKGLSGRRKSNVDLQTIKTLRSYIEPTMMWLGYDL
jgi:hypothetical protein